MALSGPILVVADEDSAVRDALAAGGNLPYRHTSQAEAVAAVMESKPSAVVLAARLPDPDHACAQQIADAVDTCGGAIIPMLAIVRPDVSAYPLALPIMAEDVATRLVPRLRAALRVRALHQTVLRRIETLADPADVPDTVDYDPIEDATVLVVGRGRNYPALTVAVGERMGLIGALAIETARSYLNAREVDGVVVGDGFNRAMVEDFVDELGADARWRDLPVIVPASAARIDAERLPNADPFSGDPEAVAAHILPFARMHAFAARLKRVSGSLDQKGTLAPETGLMTHAAFMAELHRVAATAEARGAGLSLARLSFDALLNRRAGLDAARITGRLLRTSDIACRDEDGSILIAFTETDLVTAHVVARRIASVLKHTTLSLGAERTRLGPTVALAAFRPRDTVETLVARTVDHRLVAAE
jgi:GGDEF domain-containing protein